VIAALVLLVGSATALAANASAAVLPTQTRLACNPATLPGGNAWLCRATVTTTETGPFGGTPVQFTSNRPGSFQPAPACTPPFSDFTSTVSCQVIYRPEPLELPAHIIEALYTGDAGHQRSAAGAFVEAHFPVASLSCSPGLLELGESVTCTATVADPAANLTLPTGRVRLSVVDPNEGTFSDGGVCRLEPGDVAGEASCQLGYTPTAPGTGRHGLVLRYDGDPISEPASAETVVKVGSLRFAAPGGSGADPCDRRDDPCSLFTAASANAAGTTVKAGDEVVLAPGNYSDAAGDLGPDDELVLAAGVSLHGAAARARPTITTESDGSAGLVVTHGDVVSRLNLVSLRSPSALVLEDGGIVEQVSARTAAIEAITCVQLGGLLRESACVSTGGRAAAVGGRLRGGAGATTTMRGVTANSVGPQSFGLKYVASGGSHVIVDANSTIAKGTSRDIVAEGLSDAPHTPGTGGSVEIALANSDYLTLSKVTDAGLGAAVVTPSATGASITGAPIFAADGFHEAPGSPTVDKGVTDDRSGKLDVDGQARGIGGLPDIGADEIAGASQVQLVCDPRFSHTGQAVTCTATVESQPKADPAPRGTVRFEAEGLAPSGVSPGTFAGDGVCALSRVGEGASACQVRYLPAVPASSYKIFARYEGTEHDSAATFFEILVGATRFAAPGGTGSEPCTDAANPCSLFRAASSEAPGTTLRDDDEVIVAPGTYRASRGDLGPSGAVRVGRNVFLRGAGALPPRIVLDSGVVEAGLVLGEGASASRLEVEGDDFAQSPLQLGRGAQVHDLNVLGRAPQGAACLIQTLGLTAVLTDTACVSTGFASAGLKTPETPALGGSMNVVLRNVTAFANQSTSEGMLFLLGGNGSLHVLAKAVIAKGGSNNGLGEFDVDAISQNGSIAVDLDHSDYATVFQQRATITAVGTNGNITAFPQLSADHFHELATSLTVDRGVTDAQSGATDIDGQSRSIGAAVDMGADELGLASTTTLACAAFRVRIGEETTCTATVRGSGNLAPVGRVHFETDGPGMFDSNLAPGDAADEPNCTLSQTGPAEASCHVSFEPTAVQEAIQHPTARYRGGGAYGGSQSTTFVVIPSVRYAAPSGLGAAPCTNPGRPCSLFRAATLASSGGVAMEGDEVILAPGTYTDAADDLGPNHTVKLARSLKLHGYPGKPRPIISSSFDGPVPLLEIASNDQVSHLEVSAEAAPLAVRIDQGTVEDVVVRSSADNGVACEFFEATLRSTACLASGSGSTALRGVQNQLAVRDVDALRNVTAVATGAESTGLVYATSSGLGPQTLTGRAVIARGAKTDVAAESTAAASVAVNLDHSDYEKVATIHTGSGSATVTDPGTQSNLTAPPRLAADGFHQLPGSPTIDSGISDQNSGAADLDGQGRSLGAAADIGADEVGTATPVELSCGSEPVVLGEAVACRATVTDESGAANVPSGKVRFHSDGAGGFGGADTCLLGPGSSGRSSCKILYTPTATGTAPHTITGTYLGDSKHDASSGEAMIFVTVNHATKTVLQCAPASVEVRHQIECTAAVTDLSPSAAAKPAGEVHFQASAPGTFSQPRCDIVGGGATASCQVFYTPEATGSQILAAAYQGDVGVVTHKASEGKATVEVAAPPQSPPPPGQGGGGPTGGGAPNTTLKKKPRKAAAPPTAGFTFLADQPGSRFQCKLDKKPYKPCRSPFKARKLRPGAHVFRVRAVNPQGLVDPTPAQFKWKVAR
jgi:hypothetical protein